MKMFKNSSLIIIGLTLLFSACQNTINNKPDLAVHLLSDSLKQASCVYLTTDAHHIPVISWVEIDTSNQQKAFYFARWNEKKQQFAAKKSIPIPKNTSIHEEGMPKIGFKADGTMVALFETSTPAPGHRWGIGDIRIIFSSDNGENWSQPTSIYQKKPKDASISFSGLAQLANGEIGITCLGTSQDSTKVGRPVLFFQTEGQKMTAPVVVTPEACECCRTAVAASSNGRVSVAFRDLTTENVRDISVSTSIDGGMLFHHNKDISKDEWIVNGCPHNGPSIQTRNNQNYIAWSTGGKNAGVHYAILTTSGKVLTRKHLSKNGQFIQLRLLPNNTAIAVYNESYMKNNTYYSRVVATKLNDSTFAKKVISPDKISASYPVLTPIYNRYFLVAWRNDDLTVHYRLVSTESINIPAKEASSPTERSKKNSVKNGNMIKDLVCGMNFDKSTAADSTSINGITYYFCSKHCHKAFTRQPSRYIHHE